jgi:hypothetical protein
MVDEAVAKQLTEAKERKEAALSIGQQMKEMRRKSHNRGAEPDERALAEEQVVEEIVGQPTEARSAKGHES